MAKFDIKTVKPKFVVTTSPENKIDVVVNKPIIETKLSKSFFKLKNTGGPVGPRGPQGERGEQGLPGERGPEGLPGRDGRDGVDGQDGQAATIEVASTSTLPAGSSATVSNVGSTSQARLAFGIPKGDKGDTGAAGADGDAATIQIGQVETLQPNQQCYVENVGSSTAAIFNIGIPKGEKGDSGSGSGDMTASTYDPNGTVAAAGGIPDYVDSNGGKIDTIKVNGTAQTITNKTVDISVPTKTSDLTNDGSDNTSTYVEADELATVATSGSYNDLSNKPTIPAAQVNSDWSANSGVAQILNKPSLATVATSGSYNDLSNKPTIPTVNDGQLVLSQNGSYLGSFTANSSQLVQVDIETIYADDIASTSALTPPVQTNMIADGAVTSAKLGASAVATAKLADGAVTNAKLDWSNIVETVSVSSYITPASGYTLSDTFGYRIGKMVILCFAFHGTIVSGENVIGSCSNNFACDFFGAGRVARWQGGTDNTAVTVMCIPGGDCRIYSPAANTQGMATVILVET